MQTVSLYGLFQLVLLCFSGLVQKFGATSLDEVCLRESDGLIKLVRKRDIVSFRRNRGELKPILSRVVSNFALVVQVTFGGRASFSLRCDCVPAIRCHD